MNFKNHPDETICVGQWIILYDEIPTCKIGPNNYEVYPDAQELKIETFEDRFEKLCFDLPNQIDPVTERIALLEPTSKYGKASKGTRRVRPWESASYF